MKYVEELKPGDLFLIKNDRFVLTSDFKISTNNRYKKLAVNIKNGHLQWIDDGDVVDVLDLYYRDKEGNIISLKEIKNEYSEKTTNIF